MREWQRLGRAKSENSASAREICRAGHRAPARWRATSRPCARARPRPNLEILSAAETALSRVLGRRVAAPCRPQFRKASTKVAAPLPIPRDETEELRILHAAEPRRQSGLLPAFRALLECGHHLRSNPLEFAG